MGFKRLCWTTLAFLIAAVVAHGARLGDIADVEGIRENPLVGYGLVVGLNKTGDSGSARFTIISLANALKSFGVTVSSDQIKVGNVAAVVVTAKLPPYAKRGSRIDATVASIGNAKSLQGGVLLLTPLRGTDGNIYAVAQGPVAIGGYTVTAGNDRIQKNHPTVGIVPDGATVEREIHIDFDRVERFHLNLRRPNLKTAALAAARINREFGEAIAHAIDPATIEIGVPESQRSDPVGFLSRLLDVEVEPQPPAVVVINERTGTVIVGENVRISRVAITHGNLHIEVSSRTEVSQPAPLSTGRTEVIENQEVTVTEEGGRLKLVGGVTIGDLVQALNAIGASPRDLITILQAIKRAGALQAELEIM